MNEVLEWLKSSVLGIILLGALGSILAVWILKLATPVVTYLLKLATPMAAYLWNWPREQHDYRRTKQAYFLGFSHATIELDETGRNLIAFIAFRLARFFASSLSVATSIVVLIVLVATQQATAATVGTVASATVMFSAAYWAFWEYEWLYRTYLFFWKEAMERAEMKYGEYEKEEAHQSATPEGKEGKSNTPKGENENGDVQSEKRGVQVY